MALTRAALIATLALPLAAAAAPGAGPTARQSIAADAQSQPADRPYGDGETNPDTRRHNVVAPLPLVPAQILIRPGTPGEVCLFRDPGYSGARWCVPTGTKKLSVARAGWDDAISSISISGRAIVYACRLPGFSGGCRLYAGSQAHLRGFDDAISSFIVIAGANPNAL